MPPTFDQTFAQIGQAVADQARSGLHDVQSKYEAFLTGSPAQPSSRTGDMEWSFSPDEPPPMSFGEAFRTASDMEQAEVRAKHEAAQATEAHAEQDVGLDPEF